MKVGAVLHSLYFGGAERWMVMLARHAGLQWTSIAVVGWFELGCAAVQELQSLGVPVIIGPRMRNKCAGVNQYGTDAEAVADAMSGADALVAWCAPEAITTNQWYRKPIAVVAHGCCQWTRGMVAKMQDPRARYAGVSRAAAEVCPPGAATLWNAIEPARLEPTRTRAAIRAAWGLSAETVAVGYLGRLHNDKRPEAAVAAANGLGGRAVCVLQGEGNKLSALKRQARTRLVHVPFSPHVGDFLTGVDCLVMASPFEGFCLTIVEAWHAGCPVVATATGIVPEAEERFGQLVVRVPVGATEAVLGKAVAESVGRQDLVERGRAVAREHFTPWAFGERWHAYLESIACPN